MDDKIMLFIPLFAAIFIGILAYWKASLKEVQEMKLLTKIKIISYRNLSLSVTLIGFALFLMSLAYKDTTCLENCESILLIGIGTLAGIIGGSIALFGTKFKENSESKNIPDSTQGIMEIGKGQENIPWSPKIIFHYALSSITFSSTYLIKLKREITLDDMDWSLALVVSLLLFTGILYLVKWFRIYTCETRKGEVLKSVLVICLFVFPFSLFASYYAHILKIAGCFLSTGIN